MNIYAHIFYPTKWLNNFFFSKIQTNEENFNKLTSCITIRNISFEWCQYFRVFFFSFLKQIMLFAKTS